MGVKLDVDKARKKSVGKFSSTFKATALIAGVAILIVGFNFWSSYSLKQTVDVVKLNTSVPQDGRVTQEMMYKDSMLKTEYEKQGVYQFADGTKKRAIVLWEDRERIKDAFASYYVRSDTSLYWDALSKETPKEYAYLYEMDGELLKIDIEANQFGNMLVPGDKINIRVAYEETQYVLPTEKDFILQQQMGITSDNKVTKNELLFNSVSVLDILNAEGESIFDIYYELLALPKAQQLSAVEDETFQLAVQPVEILLNVTPEEADRYMSITNKGPKYMMTLLPRTSGNLITEALSDLNIGFTRK